MCSFATKKKNSIPLHITQLALWLFLNWCFAVCASRHTSHSCEERWVCAINFSESQEKVRKKWCSLCIPRKEFVWYTKFEFKLKIEKKMKFRVNECVWVVEISSGCGCCFFSSFFQRMCVRDTFNWIRIIISYYNLLENDGISFCERFEKLSAHVYCLNSMWKWWHDVKAFDIVKWCRCLLLIFNKCVKP